MKNADAIVCWRSVEKLTDEEGSAVIISCGNASFEGPSWAVDCVGEWTDWKEIRFTGDTQIECLEAAAKAKEAFENATT